MALGAQNLFNEQEQHILFPNRRSNSETPSSVSNFILKGDKFYDQPAAFYYKDRARLRFNVSDEFSKYFVLIKGLIEFSRPSQLKFTFTPDQKQIETDLDVIQFEELNKLFLVVYRELLKEIRFKTALKNAIEFEQRYKREGAKVYSGLF